MVRPIRCVLSERLMEVDLNPSMGRTGTTLDIAMAESFVSTLKAELVSRMKFPSRQATKTAFPQSTWRTSTTPAGCTHLKATGVPPTSRRREWKEPGLRKVNVPALVGEAHLKGSLHNFLKYSLRIHRPSVIMWAHTHIRALRERQTHREAGAQSLRTP